MPLYPSNPSRQLFQRYLTQTQSHPDRNPDGTFTKGSELAKELGSKGGHVAHEHQVEKQQTEEEGRNPDGTFKAGSKLAHDLGEKGGHASHQN